MTRREVSTSTSPNRATLLVAAAAVLGLLVVPIATATTTGGSGDPEATGSASVKKKLKKLKKRVAQLEQQVSGPAGGDLTGSYPNPSIGAGRVTNPKLASNAVDSGKVVANSLTGADIIEGTLDLDLEPVVRTSANNSNSPKQVLPPCPPGKFVLTVGAQILGGTSGTSPNALSEVVITAIESHGTFGAVTAHETDSIAGTWQLEAGVICARIAF